MKILNLYSGIGGNRKLWNELGDCEITAVENVPAIADIYHDFFPYDFIWSSPPCPSHSRFNFLTNQQEGKKVKYPDMNLYQEIIYLKHWFKGKFVVENVISYYNPLIPPIESNNHYIWCNFSFSPMPNYVRGIKRKNEEDFVREKLVGFDLSKYKFPTKRFRRMLINNCVEPELGKHILFCAFNKTSLF